MDRSRVPRSARHLLRECFDLDLLRDGQLEAIADVVHANEPSAAVISVMATGSGDVCDVLAIADLLLCSVDIADPRSLF